MYKNSLLSHDLSSTRKITQKAYVLTFDIKVLLHSSIQRIFHSCSQVVFLILLTAVTEASVDLVRDYETGNGLPIELHSQIVVEAERQLVCEH